MKQKFQHQVYSQSEVVNNILKIYQDSKAVHTGYNWYQDAHRIARDWAQEFGLTTLQAAGVIAALSPNTSWEMNLEIAEEFLRTGTCGHTGTMLSKAGQCIVSNSVEESLEILNGMKISNFFLNILFPDIQTGVTIDRHAVAIAMGEVPAGPIKMTQKQYRFFQIAYEIAADVLGLLPHQLQAVTWVKWRQLKKAEV